MVQLGWGGKEIVEELVDLGKIEGGPRACKAIGGMSDERGHCFIRGYRDPADPNRFTIKRMEYIPREVTPVHTVEGT
jgi:hypothetical protein